LSDGKFHEVSPQPALFHQAGLPNLDLAADGESLTRRAEFDDMGKNTSPTWVQTSVDPDADRTDPGTTVWFDSEVDDFDLLHVQWDVDGKGLLALQRDREMDQPIQIVRYDMPRHPMVLGEIPVGSPAFDWPILVWGAARSTDVEMLVTAIEMAPDPAGGSSSTGRETLLRYSTATGLIVPLVGPLRHLQLVCGFECGR
jgi:hypothetical protein